MIKLQIFLMFKVTKMLLRNSSGKSQLCDYGAEKVKTYGHYVFYTSLNITSLASECRIIYLIIKREVARYVRN